LPARVQAYRPAWLDELCLSGEVVWGRIGSRTPQPEADASSGGRVPSRATPLGVALRADLPWLLVAARGEATPSPPGPGAARDLLDCLTERGASFQSELASATSRVPSEIEAGLWDLVSRGFVTADGVHALRGLLGARERWAKTRDTRSPRRRLRRGARGHAPAEGRWALLPPAASVDSDELAEAVCEQLLARYGVIFYDLLARESLALPWRDLVWALRRLEARGSIRGGRFVSGFTGEQFALPGAVDALRRTRKLERSGEIVELSAADPLNLVGIVTPGPRIPAVRAQRVAYRDGEWVAEASPTTAQNWRGA
jgi:ATP-dependent Lhr-like helicase